MDQENEEVVVIVTGGADGIGKAIATAFANKKYKLAILDIQDEKGSQTVEELNKLTKAAYFHCDVSQTDEIQQTFDQVTNYFGQVNILINNAGIPVRDYIGDIDEEKWNTFVNINIKSVFFFSKIFSEYIRSKSSGFGRIISISSIRSDAFDDYHTGYSISKSAINTITKAFAISYGEDGITANAISPGFVHTPMTEHYMEDKKAVSIIEGISPIRRMVEQSEISSLAVFLASKEASAINGQVIVINGGGTSFTGLFQ